VCYPNNSDLVSYSGLDSLLQVFILAKAACQVQSPDTPVSLGESLKLCDVHMVVNEVTNARNHGVEHFGADFGGLYADDKVVIHDRTRGDDERCPLVHTVKCMLDFGVEVGYGVLHQTSAVALIPVNVLQAFFTSQIVLEGSVQ